MHGGNYISRTVTYVASVNSAAKSTRKHRLGFHLTGRILFISRLRWWKNFIFVWKKQSYSEVAVICCDSHVHAKILIYMLNATLFFSSNAQFFPIEFCYDKHAYLKCIIINLSSKSNWGRFKNWMGEGSTLSNLVDIIYKLISQIHALQLYMELIWPAGHANANLDFF